MWLPSALIIVHRKLDLVACWLSIYVYVLT